MFSGYFRIRKHRREVQSGSKIMSGRDFRSFLTQQRSRGSSKGELLNSILSGSRRKMPFNKLNYDSILESISLAKQAGDYQVKHMKTLAKRGRDAQEQEILKQHREIWYKESKALNDLLARTQLELDKWQARVILDTNLGLADCLHNVYQIQRTLSADRKQFENNTVQSVNRLRARLATNTVSNSDIERELERMKEEFSQLEQQLREEYDNLIVELREAGEKEERVISVPDEMARLLYPSSAVRQHVMSELLKLDEKYETQLRELEEEKRVIRLVKPALSEDDDFHIRSVIEQYNSAPPACRRALFIDRLMRGLPHKTREELVSYEQWLRASAHNGAKRKLTIASWTEAKASLTRCLVAAVNEAWLEVEKRRLNEQEREEQLSLCQELSEKVSQWHQHKLEIEKQQAEQARRDRAVMEEAMKKESQERDKRKRRTMEKVREYHRAQELQRQEEEELYQQQMREWRAAVDEQGRMNKERVQYREDLLATKHQQLAQAAQEKVEEERRKEERLESIRAQVRVTVESDPLRTMSDTVSTRARMTHQDTEQPLFPLHSYTADKVTGDPRFKVEAALRKAGLLSTDYARHVLSHIPPSLPPRRDMTSTLFKQE